MDEMKYFVERTDRRLERIETNIERILAFKWQIIGGAVAISSIVSLAISILYGK